MGVGGRRKRRPALRSSARPDPHTDSLRGDERMARRMQDELAADEGRALATLDDVWRPYAQQRMSDSRDYADAFKRLPVELAREFEPERGWTKGVDWALIEPSRHRSPSSGAGNSAQGRRLPRAGHCPGGADRGSGPRPAKRWLVYTGQGRRPRPPAAAQGRVRRR